MPSAPAASSPASPAPGPSVNSFQASAPGRASADATATWVPGGAPPAAPPGPTGPAADARPGSAPWAPDPEPTPRPADEPAAPPWAVARPSSAPVDEDDDDYDDDEPARRLHPYTWLHVLVLAVVAFVLGFLIMLLVIQTRGAQGDEETAAALAVVSTWWAPPVS